MFKLIKPTIRVIQQDGQSRHATDQERYVQIKIHSTKINDQNQYVIQIIDFSLNIINRKIQTQNELENQIRGTVCHEMQNPLNSIIHSSDLIHRMSEGLKEVKKSLADNKPAAKRLQVIIDDLIAKSKMQNSSTKLLKFFVRDLLDFQQIKMNKLRKDIQKFNLREAIKEVVDVVEYQASRAGLPIIVDYISDELKDEDYEIRTDSLRLQQVLLNLLSNAIKYTERGEITLLVALN